VVVGGGGRQVGMGVYEGGEGARDGMGMTWVASEGGGEDGGGEGGGRRG